MEVITLRCVTSYDNDRKVVRLFPSVRVSRDQLRCTRIDPYGDALFTLASHIDTMGLGPVEIALLQAVIIFRGGVLVYVVVIGGSHFAE